MSKPLPNSFQNPLSRRGENRRGIDGRFIQMSLPSLETEDMDEEETQSEEEERESTPVRETSSEQMEESFDLTPTTPIGRERPKLVRNRDPKSPGANNLKLHVDNMNEQHLEQAIETITENPTTTTIVDNTGNEYQIKMEINEIPNTNELDTNNQQIRRSSRLRSNNPIIRFGNPLTHKRLHETPLNKSPDRKVSERRPAGERTR